MNRLKISDCGAVWEDLRRQACQLENEIDHKLVSFSKLGTNYSNYTALGSNAASSKVSTSHLVDNMSADIQQLLISLSKINDRMSEYLNSDGKRLQTPMVLHTLQRHHEILKDYYHEYEKTKSNISAFKEREDLLGSIDNSIRYSNNGSHTDLYLKEQEHLLSSERLIDDQISLATATKGNLQSQKGILYGVTENMNSLANRFPIINSLMQRINLRKRRDTIIIALVISVCLIFLIVYKLSW